MGKFGVKERNREGQMVVDFAKRMDMAVVNTYFQKREEHKVTYKSGDLEKAYDRVPREELWYCMRKSGVAEKYVRVVQDMYERSRTVVRCAVGQTEEFKVEVGLHQGLALSPFLFAIVMDQLSEEVRQESPWTMMFADDIVSCSESREQVEENLERWRFSLERRGMKVSRSKTEYMCVNEREGSGTVRLQGEEVKKVQEFKYLGSTVQSNGECGKEVKKRVQAEHEAENSDDIITADQKTVIQTDSVRLVNGGSRCAGRVEVLHDGQWGTADIFVCISWMLELLVQCSGRVEVFHGGSWSTVCDADFDQQDAEVVCRELGCGIPVEVRGSAVFGRGEGHTEARLVNGPDSCSGRVELQYLSEWGTVCAVGWDMRAADVLCAQLDCGRAMAVVEVEWFGAGSDNIGADVFDCQGKETHLSRCGVSSWSRAACSHRHDAGVICNGSSVAVHEGRVRLSGMNVFNPTHSSIRLVGSRGDCAGRLEVFHSGSWGTVCDDSWDIEDAQVVCRQLQCGVALSTHIPAWFGPGTGSIWLNEVECEGNETSLWNCRFQLCEEGECGHHEDVGVICSEFKEIRLTEGCEGNLEVFYNGTWGNVCHNQMDDETCPSSPWGQNRCDNRDEVARITCTDDGKSPRTQENCSSLPSQKHCSKHWSLRLSGGKGSCSGRLEVYHNSTWGSVCDDQWNIRNAQVVCRQLGCGSALSADRKVSSGSGEGTIWLNRVKCRGDEIHLWDCHHSLKKHTDCSHAGVTCADISTVSTTTPTTTTTTTTTITTTKSVRDPPTPPLVLFVLGTLLFLALVLLLVLFYQNRVLRRGSLLSEEQHSGYEDVDDELLSVKSGMGEKAEYYDDVIDTSDLISDPGRVDPPENYDDAVTAGPIPDNVDEDEAENYDDAITADQKSVILTEDVSENYDDAVTTETNPNIIT
ncbi:hypothetical protein QTP70_001249, partial [Hemibagrus guttatus]